MSTRESAPLAAVFGAPGIVSVVVPAFVGRLPLAMTALSLVLLIHEKTGSYAAAGFVTAFVAVGEAVGQPLQGRFIDRTGQTRVLLCSATTFPLALAAVLALASAGAPLVALAGATLCVGLAIPPVMASMRALWPSMLDRAAHVEAAYSVESVIQECLFLVGPVLVTLLVALASPAGAVIGTAALGTVGTVAFALSRPSRDWRPVSTTDRAHVASLSGASRVLPVVYASTLLQGIVFGAMQIGVPAFSTAREQTELIGLLFAAFAVGSLASGAWYASTRHDADLRTRYLRTLAVHALGGVLLFASPNVVALAGALLLLGSSIAPMFALATLAVQRIADPRRLTQAFAWLSTATVSGIAVGNAAAGVSVAAIGVRGAFGLLAAIAVVNVGIAWFSRRHLGEPRLPRRSHPR